ncbi:serine hydrolase domain-containing protein [Pseudoalteromonas sp. T1lg65]|uniref:serine hydrolase domain-containing protein n=1 Tax=Pseudoalteromonas sp. T1lg65 TaxID=2077101 RepID=UPI003F78CB8E
MVYKYVVCAILFTCFTSFASDYSDLDNYIVKAKSLTQSVSGTSVVLIKDGNIVHEVHVGMADVKNKIPVDTNSVYYFASTTKAIMGLAVLQAEQKGLLTKDSTLKQLFPNIKFKYIDANNYTVRDLLSHTSGLENEAMTWAFSYTGDHDKAQRLSFVASLKKHPEIKKGEFDYSNLGYNLMAIWFDENYTGGWGNAINELVLSPVGMKNSTADVDNARRIGWPIPKPYTYKYQDGQAEIYMNKSNSTLYSVGIFARPRDWAKLITHLIPSNVEKSVFPKSVLNDSRTLLVSNLDSYFSGYGWGWMHSKIADVPVLAHTGGFDGASVEVSYSPQKNIGVVIVHNESGLIANELSGSISEIAYKMLTGQKVANLIASHHKEMKENSLFVEEVKVKLAKKRNELSNYEDRFAERHSSLIGKYVHADAGTIAIKPKDKGLQLFWGDLQSKVYPSKYDDKFILELRPGKFYDLNVSKDSAVITLRGWKFTKQ